MSYQSHPELAGFLIPEHTADWVAQVQYIPEPPIEVRGAMNPWGLERKRAQFQREEAAWRTIQTLKGEYRAIEQDLARRARIFNDALAHLERVVGKKVGQGPIGTYGGMALTLLPGFGWASAVYTGITMLVNMFVGNHQKKQIADLMARMEVERVAMVRGQQRLREIQAHVSDLTQTAKQVAVEQAAHVKAVIQKQDAVVQKRREAEKEVSRAHIAEVLRIRQMAKNRVPYVSTDAL